MAAALVRLGADVNVRHRDDADTPLIRAARMGNACGAIVVTRHGCANFMPTLDEVAAFVAERGEAAI